MYRFIYTAKVHTYRSIVDEADVHHGLEDAVFDPVFSVQRADLGEEGVVEFFAFDGGGGFVEVGLVAFFRRCQ